VGVSNIFELLDDETDDEPGKKASPAGVKQETPQNKAKPSKETAAPQPKSKQPPAKNEKTNDSKENRSPKPDKVEKRPAKGGEAPVGSSEGEDEKKRRQVRQGSSERATDRKRSDRPPREQQPPQQGTSAASSTSVPTPLGGSGGGGGGGGGKVKRVYERRSGTGRGREGKKGGSGRGNWGTVADDQSAQAETADHEEDSSQSKEETPKTEAEPIPETEEERKEREQREFDEKAIDLQEFKKRMEEKAPKIPLPEPRKAEDSGEGFALTREKDDDASGRQKAKKTAKEGAKDAAPKKQVPVDQFFNVQGEQRRDRGSFRKGGNNPNKSFGRGKRGGKTSAPSFDASSFPALSTKA